MGSSVLIFTSCFTSSNNRALSPASTNARRWAAKITTRAHLSFSTCGFSFSFFVVGSCPSAGLYAFCWWHLFPFFLFCLFLSFGASFRHYVPLQQNVQRLNRLNCVCLPFLIRLPYCITRDCESLHPEIGGNSSISYCHILLVCLLFCWTTIRQERLVSLTAPAFSFSLQK